MTPLLNSFVVVAQAGSSGPANAETMKLVFFGLLFAAMWFLFIAPQRKKQKDHAKMIAGLDVGDQIITSGGLYGEITSKKDDRFSVQIASGVRVEIARGFVQDIVRKDGAASK